MTSSEFELTQGRPRRRRHLFQNARLNQVGWAALTAASLLSAALGAVIATRVGGPSWIGAVVGLPLVVLVLLVFDRRRTRQGHIGFGWTEDVAEVEAAAEELRRRGVEVGAQQDIPSLTFRRRDQRVVAEVLGLPPGRFPWQWICALLARLRRVAQAPDRGRGSDLGVLPAKADNRWMGSESDGAGPTVPRLFSNRWADDVPPGMGRNTCDCFDYSPASQPISHSVWFHGERQDTSAPGWRHLLTLIEGAKADGRPEFRPFMELSPAERDQIVTLPAEIGELSQVRHLLLYGSPLRRLPVEIAAMARLEELTVYTSYRLHWFPYELSRCPNLRKSTVSTRAVYGNAHFRPPFPALARVTDISGLDLNDLDPGRFGASSATRCSVCQGPMAGLVWQRWITLRIATDALPMLVNACSEGCIRDLPTPLPGFIDHPHQGGELQQPPARYLP